MLNRLFYTLTLCTLSANIFANIDTAAFSKLHQSGISIQVANGGISSGYYTSDHTYTFGIGGLTYASLKTDTTKDSATTAVTTTEKEKGFDSYLYLRKNTALTTNSVFGFGVSAGKKIPTSGDTRKLKKDYNIQQYMMLEL